MPSDSPHPSALGHRRVRGVAVAVALALVVAVAGCGGDDDTATPSSAAPSTAAPSDGSSSASTTAVPAAMRTVETELGPVEIPVDPQHIVALDEYAAMNILALGIEPAVVLGSYQAEISQQVLTDAGVEVIEPDAAELNLEDIAAERPDLVVLTDEPRFADSYDLLAEIAPTVVLPYDRPWRDAIQSTAAIFDRHAEGARLTEALEERIDELAAEVQADPTSISLLCEFFDQLCAVSNEAPLSGLIAEVGFSRPLAQAEGTPFEGYASIIALSSEVIGEHDADVVVVFSGIGFNAEVVRSLPTFQALPAVVDGRSFEADGQTWLGTFPFAIYWVLEDLAALSGGDGRAAPGTIADSTSRYARFQALTG